MVSERKIEQFQVLKVIHAGRNMQFTDVVLENASRQGDFMVALSLNDKGEAYEGPVPSRRAPECSERNYLNKVNGALGNINNKDALVGTLRNLRETLEKCSQQID